MDPWYAKMAPRPPGRCTASLVLVQSAVSLIRSPASSLVPLLTCLGLKTYSQRHLRTHQYVRLALLDWRIFLILESLKILEWSLNTFLFSPGSGCGGLKDLVGTEGMLASMDHPRVTVTELPASGISVCPQGKTSTFTLATSPWRRPHCALMTKSTFSDSVGTLGA